MHGFYYLRATNHRPTAYIAAATQSMIGNVAAESAFAMLRALGRVVLVERA